MWFKGMLEGFATVEANNEEEAKKKIIDRIAASYMDDPDSVTLWEVPRPPESEIYYDEEEDED